MSLTGQKFGRLTAVMLVEKRPQTSMNRWNCRCDCGNEKVVLHGNLKAGYTKSCGCLWIENVKGRSRSLPGKPSWLNAIWQNYTQGARKRGVPFELSLAQVESLIEQPCHYCGAEPRNGIDRKDSSLGYNLLNCLPCCTICNVMKMALTYKDFLEHVGRIVTHVRD